MANVWVRSGFDPDAPDDVHVIVAVDPDGTAEEERAMSRVMSGAHEGDGAFYVLQTDAWMERALEGDTLVLDVVAYPVVLQGVDLAGVPERSRVDPDAIRVLRAATTVDPEVFARAQDVTVVVEVPPGTGIDDIVAGISDEAVTPVIFAPPPE